MSDATSSQTPPAGFDLLAVPKQVWGAVPERVLRQRRVLPVELIRGTGRVRLRLATAAPGDLAALDEVAFVSGFLVEPVAVGAAELERALAFHLDGVRPGADQPPQAIELDEGSSSDSPGDGWLVPLADDAGWHPTRGGGRG